MKGRKPIPHALKVLNGTASSKKARVAPDIEAPLACPPWLSNEAKKEWMRVVPLLSELGVVTALDRGILSAYCAAVALHQKAVQEVQRTGSVIENDSGELVKSPWVNIMDKQAQILHKLSAELGMTPAMRERMQFHQKPKAVTGWEEFS